MVLNQLWLERRLTPGDAARLLQRSEAEARGVLERLVEAGLVESRQEAGNRVYHLAAATYRKSGTKSGIHPSKEY